MAPQEAMSIGNPAAVAAASRHYWAGLQDYADSGSEYFQKVNTIKPPQPVPLQEPIGTSGPQGKVVPLTIISDPANWKAADLRGHEAEYTYTFTESDISELQAAVAKLEARGITDGRQIQQLTKADYELPTLGPKIVELGRETSLGRGFQLFRNYPVQQFTRLQLVLSYWGIAKHLGRNLVCQTDIRDPQSAWNTAEGDFYGSVLNHVSAGGHVITSNEIAQIPLPFHADQGATDIISLLSVGKSKAGGASRWVSAIAIHNELLRRGRKDLVAALTSPGWWATAKVDQSRTLKDGAGNAIWENTTPFKYHNGWLSVYWTAYHGNAEEQKRLGYELTPLQEEAYWAVNALANDPEFYLEKLLEPGEMEWLANHSIFHSRAPIQDDGHNIRHLVRWWVASDAAEHRPLHPRYQSTHNVQPKGGFVVPDGSEVELPIDPPSRKPSAAAAT